MNSKPIFALALLLPLAAMSALLAWNYPHLTPDIVFNVYASTNYWATNVSPVFDEVSTESDDTNDWVITGWMTNVFETCSMNWSNWPMVATVTNTFLPIQLTGSFRFFHVQASNTFNHRVSQP